MTTGALWHWLVRLLYFLGGNFKSGWCLLILASSLAIKSIIDVASTLSLLPWGINFLISEGRVRLNIYRLKLISQCARGTLLWHCFGVEISSHHRETFFGLFLECFGLFRLQVRDHVLVFQIGHNIMVFHVVYIKSVQKISETLLSFFELIKEFLSVRSGLSGCSSTDMFLNLFPLLVVNFQSL